MIFVKVTSNRSQSDECMEFWGNYMLIFLTLKMRRKLIISLAISHLLNVDIILLNCDAQSKAKLECCFKACTRFIYNLRRFDSTAPYDRTIIGCSLHVHYKLRMSIFLKRNIVFWFYTKFIELKWTCERNWL